MAGNSASADWQIGIQEGQSQDITPATVSSLLAGQDVTQFLPSALASALTGLRINSFDVSYNVDLQSVSYFTIGVSATNGWTIVDKQILLLPGLQVNLTLTKLAGNAPWQTTASVMGTFVLGGVNVPAYLGASLGSTTSWSFGLQPGQKVTLPSFSDLLALAGGPAFMSSLPPGSAVYRRSISTHCMLISTLLRMS